MFSKLSIALSAVSAKAIVGTNIGGWMVLEPWITPSLFYQFLGKTSEEGVGMDSWTLCEALGPEAGNSVMQAHWKSFYTADHIKDLADKGVKMVRLPIGDWTLKPYGPYVGCMDGAEDWIQWMFDTCAENGIEVLLDVHAMKDSQNGFDNSGKTTPVIWDQDTHFNFTHWPQSHADWIGPWAGDKIDHINYANLQWGLDVAEGLLQRWGDHSAFAAFEPVNEPWWNTDLVVLKDFYRQVRKMVQKYAPQAYFVFHNSFRYDVNQWNDLFADDDIEKVAFDHHYYQAFNQPAFTTVEDSCNDYEQNAAYADQFKYEVWFGEWALATDVCAMWLGGFNDGNTKPQAECQWVDCPETYLPVDIFTNATVDPSIASNGPYGYGIDGDSSYYVVKNGKCSKDSGFFSDDDVAAIAKCALKSYDAHLNRTFMWTGHNEIEERWSYTLAFEKGWINPASWEDEKEVEL